MDGVMPARSNDLLFVEQFYFPEGWGGAELPRDLTSHLVRLRCDVEVVCGSDLYAPVTGDPGPDPAALGVRIRRLPSPLGGSARVGKLGRQLWFCAHLLPRLLFGRRPGLFVSQTNPPLAVPIVALVSRLRRRPYLLIAMDVYPEVIEAHGELPALGPLVRFLKALFDAAYRQADRVVALGPVMRQRLLAKGVAPGRIVEISNWSTGADGVVRGDSNDLRREWNLAGRFVVLYSGNLGIGHEFDTLLAGFARACGPVPEASLVIIGAGSRLEEARRKTVELGLADRVQFRDFVPAARLPESLGLADLAVVTLRPGFEGLIVPSKVLGYMARGLPVLYVGPRSDVDHYLERYRCGVSLRNGDVDGVCAAIVAAHADPQALKAMGEAGRAGYNADLSRERALQRYEEVIADCLGARTASPSS
jgi:glycosyltransferase involved in cell wall biosynthesis